MGLRSIHSNRNWTDFAARLGDDGVARAMAKIVEVKADLGENNEAVADEFPIGLADFEADQVHLLKARAYFVNAEARRQRNKGSGTLKVPIRSEGPRVDGLLENWSQPDWAPIDQSGTAAYFDSKNKPYDVRGALAVSTDRLFAAFRVGDPDLLRNSGESPSALFKTGGALDLMLGVDGQADPKRSRPVAGDLRLLVTRVKGQTAAMLYRAVVPGTTRPAPFSSPWRTVTLDEVKDVSSERNSPLPTATMKFRFRWPRWASNRCPINRSRAT
ncbi:MAG: hypothetical protein AB9869_21145 [Verrucomicrobiia bacterium]